MAQMANLGSEVFRTINWRKKGSEDDSQRAFFRALELLDLTIADKKKGEVKGIGSFKRSFS